RRGAGALGRLRGIPDRGFERLARWSGMRSPGSSGASVPSTTPATGGGREMDCSVMDTLTHHVPSPYLDPAGGPDALGYDRAAVHTGAAERAPPAGRPER